MINIIEKKYKFCKKTIKVYERMEFFKEKYEVFLIERIINSKICGFGLFLIQKFWYS